MTGRASDDPAAGFPRLNAAFFFVLGVMAFHEAEHAAQVVQKHALGASCPNDCRGLLGFVFDLEWVHFVYNTSTLLALAGLYAGYRMWRRGWRSAGRLGWALLTGAIALQSYHVVEHTAKLDQWLANGHHSPTPGLLGMHFSLVELHFVLNTSVFLLVLGGWLGLGFHRHLVSPTQRTLSLVAAGLLALLAAGGGIAWTKRPPTSHLRAGIHHGPIVLDRAQRLVGKPGTVVHGGIRITADDVVVRDLTVRGGEYGIEVQGADGVLLERVRVVGSVLDGIHVRRGSVTIRRCTISALRSKYAQAIDISFSFDRPPSLVSGCSIDGRREGIVSHFARLAVRRNRVRGTTLRAIAMTEMSMGSIEKNTIEGGLGVGIFCGDYSHCEVDRNVVSRIRPDHASDDLTRQGVAIQAHYGARLELGRNRVSASPGGITAVIGARIVRD